MCKQCRQLRKVHKLQAHILGQLPDRIVVLVMDDPSSFYEKISKRTKRWATLESASHICCLQVCGKMQDCELVVEDQVTYVIVSRVHV